MSARLLTVGPPSRPTVEPLVATILLPGSSGGSRLSHHGGFSHASRVQATYRVWCSPQESCTAIERARHDIGQTESVPWSFEALTAALAHEANVTETALRRAVQLSVTPAQQECSSVEALLASLAKLLVVKLSMRAHPTQRTFAWVDVDWPAYKRSAPPPPPWRRFWPSAGSIAIARHERACHNELRGARHEACPLGHVLYGDRAAWARLLPLYFARVRQLVHEATDDGSLAGPRNAGAAPTATPRPGSGAHHAAEVTKARGADHDATTGAGRHAPLCSESAVLQDVEERHAAERPSADRGFAFRSPLFDEFETRETAAARAPDAAPAPQERLPRPPQPPLELPLHGWGWEGVAPCPVALSLLGSSPSRPESWGHSYAEDTPRRLSASADDHPMASRLPSDGLCTRG